MVATWRGSSIWSRSWSGLAAICFAFTFGFFASLPARAEEVWRDTTVQVIEGTTVVGDLHIVAGRAEVLGNVTGNLVATAGFLNVVGSVGGRVTAAGGRIELRGPVQGSVEVAGASVALYGRIDGDVIVRGGTITVVEQATIGGDLVLAGASAIIVDGSRIGGDVRGISGSLTIEGRIDGDVRVSVHRFTIAAPASIGGAVDYEARAELRREPGAVVVGSIVRRDPADRLPFGSFLLWHEAALLRFGVVVVLGIVLVVLFPDRLALIADRPRLQPVDTLLNGAGVAMLSPIALLLLALGLVTLPLAIAGGMLFLSGLCLSPVLAGLSLGRNVLHLSAADHGRWRSCLGLSIGSAALSVLQLLPVPYLTPVVLILTILVGVGALVSPGERDCASVVGMPTPGRLRSSLALGAGLLIGGIAAAAGLAAITIGGAGGLALAFVASRRGVVAWTIEPERLLFAAGMLSAIALVLSVAVLIVSHRRSRPSST